jgi:hypothetical protein
MRAALILVPVLLLAAGAARAEPPPLPPWAEAPVPAIRLPEGLIGGRASARPFTPADGDAQPVRPKGTVQTAVDHRFSKTTVGSLGYLCGLTPSRTDLGASSSQEPAGTFLGGQIRLAF